MNSVGADLQMFKSGSNNRGVAEVKDIMATGKRSQVARLVLWTFIHTFSGYLNWILEKDLFLEMFADTGQEVIECGRDFAEISCCWVYEIGRGGISLP